jgi:cell division protein FtsB
MSERLTEEEVKEAFECHCWLCRKSLRDHIAAQQAEITRLVARVGELEEQLERFSSGTREHNPNTFYLETTATNPPAAQALANGEQAR